MLDDLLTLFRRRRAPARRRRPAAADSRWRINLATMGGLIGFGRPDRIPRDGPPMRPRRAYQEVDDWRPAPSYAQHPGQYAQPQPDETADWQAALAFENARLISEALEMRKALEARKVIERAKGILQHRQGITEEQAYLNLRSESRRLQRPMRDLAEAIVLAEELHRKGSKKETV